MVITGICWLAPLERRVMVRVSLPDIPVAIAKRLKIRVVNQAGLRYAMPRVWPSTGRPAMFRFAGRGTGHPRPMRAEEGDESIEELAKDAAKAEDELERATDKTVDKAGPATKPAHRQE